MRIPIDPFDYQILNLSQQFYLDYPHTLYKEILKKKARPYACLLLQSHYGYFICIPYRSHINHTYAFRFKKSARSRKMKSGLDYTKIVIINDLKYISASNAIVDKDEFNETRLHIEQIKNNSQKYIDNYARYHRGEIPLSDNRKFERIYQYSTLKYFHHELLIPTSPDIPSEVPSLSGDREAAGCNGNIADSHGR